MAIILHVDMDAFFAAIEERDNPQFRGKPLVVGADPRGGFGRGVVSTANYEARKYGIRSAMPISWAYRANPKAIFLPVDYQRYSQISTKIMSILKSYAQRFEQVSVDEAYLEVTSDKKQVTSCRKAKLIAEKIKKEIWEQERLTCTIGIAPNKLVAKIASDCKKPDGLTIVEPVNINSFLDPKPVQVIPGIGPKTTQVLNQIGIHTITELRNFDLNRLKELLGSHGENIWNLAWGRDSREVTEEHEVKSVGRQTTFLQDTRSSQEMVKTILELLEETFKDLKRQNLQGQTLTIVVRYIGFDTHSSQKNLGRKLTFEDARKLALQLLLPYLNKKPVRLVGVRISSLC